jgi:hypothetical protein
MRLLAILFATALFAPAAHADRQPVVSRLPRLQSIDDLVGTWKASIRPVLSTCGPVTPAARRETTWTIAIKEGQLLITTETGRTFGVATPALDKLGGHHISVALADRAKPLSGSMQLMMSLRDHFYVKQLVLDTTSRGEMCATTYEIGGKRA